MRKNTLTALVCMGFLAMSVIACGHRETISDTSGSGNVTEAKKDADANGKKVEIELFHQKQENVDLYKTLVDKFMEENPDIQVNITLGESGTKTLISRIAAGEVPELISIYPWNASYKDMTAEGLFRDLSDEPFMDRVNEDVLKQCEYEGKLYALPLTMNAFGLYYNMDIFNDLGLTVPKTYDEMWDVCEKLENAGYQAFSFPDKNSGRVVQLFDRSLGGCVDHDFAKKCDELVKGNYKVTEDENIRKFAEAIVKIHEHCNEDSLGYDEQPSYEEFTSGKSAMFIDGSWAVSTIQAMNPEMHFACTAIPPISTEEFYTSGSIDTAYAISSECDDEQVAACIKFLNFIVREDIAQEFCDGDKNPNLVKGVNYSVPELEDINRYIDEGRFVPSLARVWTQDLRNNIAPDIQALILDKDVDAFLENFQAQIEEYYTQRD